MYNKRLGLTTAMTGALLGLTVLFPCCAFAQKNDRREPPATRDIDPFKDIEISHEWQRAVIELEQRDILQGAPEDYLSKANAKRFVTRYEVAQAIFRLIARTHRFDKVFSHRPTELFPAVFAPAQKVNVFPPADPFKDVDKNHWQNYSPAIDLQPMGILEGYPGDYFKGRRMLTRGELAVLVARLLRRVQKEPQLDIKLAEFKDVDGDEYWFGSMLVAVGSGVMSREERFYGHRPDSFGGGRPVTRAEFALTLYRLMRLSE